MRYTRGIMASLIPAACGLALFAFLITPSIADDKPAAPATKPVTPKITPKVAPPPGSPKVVTVAIAISALRKEAADSWKQSESWPRTKSDFAAEKNWSIPSDAVVQALTRRLDNNAGIDAYIKWQLLSFTPKIDQADDKTLRQLVASMPRPFPQPSVSEETLGNPDPKEVAMSFGRQMAYVQNVTPVVGNGAVAYKPQMSVIGAGAGSGGGVGIQRTESPEITHQRRLALVNDINSDLAASRTTIAAGNAAITAYRTSVAQWLPQTPALKLVLLFKELHDRIEAGDDTCQDALQRLLAAAKESAADPSVTPELRASMLDTAQNLGALHIAVTETVYLENERIKPKGHYLTLGSNEVKLLMSYFQIGAK